MKTNETKKAYAPYDYNTLVYSTRIRSVIFRYDALGQLKGYILKDRYIADIIADPNYAEFRINGLDIRAAFNALAAQYKKNTKVAKEMYLRLIDTIIAYNKVLMNEHTLEAKLNNAAGSEYYQTKEVMTDNLVERDALLNILGLDLDYFDSYTEDMYEIALAFAADYDVYPASHKLQTKQSGNIPNLGIGVKFDDRERYTDVARVTVACKCNKVYTTLQDKQIAILHAKYIAKTLGKSAMRTTNVTDENGEVKTVTTREARLTWANMAEEQRDFLYEADDIIRDDDDQRDFFYDDQRDVIDDDDDTMDDEDDIIWEI